MEAAGWGAVELLMVCKPFAKVLPEDGVPLGVVAVPVVPLMDLDRNPGMEEPSAPPAPVFNAL